VRRNPAKTTTLKGSGCGYYQHHKHGLLRRTSRIPSPYTSDFEAASRFGGAETSVLPTSSVVLAIPFFPYSNNGEIPHLRAETGARTTDTLGKLRAH